MERTLSAYVTDTNLWIDLHCGGLVSFVLESMSDLRVTDIALHELEREPSGNHLIDCGLTVLELEGPQIAELFALRGAYPGLSTEDLSALVAAKSMSAVLITGDKNLRTLAETMGVSVHGTLWVLEHLVEEHNLPSAVALDALAVMIAEGARFPAESVAALKRRLKAD